MTIKLECEFGGKHLSIETGRIARQANGAVIVRCGDTVVLVTAVASKKSREGINFFPLTVDFQEKFYAAGKIPGGFFKREARPSSKATLTARLIDRPLRPLFPDGFLNDVHIVATTLSVDGENEPDVLALVGASTALMISDIPFSGPVGAMRVGRANGEFICNPSPAEQEKSDIEFLVSGTKDAITMVEGGAKIVPEEEVLEAILFAHKSMQPLIQFQQELARKVGNKKMEFKPVEADAKLKKGIESFALSRLKEAMHLSEKKERNEALDQLKEEAVEKAVETFSEEEKESKTGEASELFDELKKQYARTYTLETKKRIDQRSYTDIRPIQIEVGLLPRTHGSAVFTRGETQAVVVVTLGTSEDEQRIDSIEGESTQRFILHYNFPPFSVGEVGALRGPGRREIGHGSLAERALEGVIPTDDKFPYTIRVVSEITESNGSSSMASVCGGTLSLMDAGVPIQAPVAGIAMGLVKEGDKFAVLSDILGDEDALGDMDFKVAGTETGVTALQMDIKIGGITEEIMRKALAQAREGRLFILGKMKEAISEVRKEISPHAPRIHKMMIPKDKIRDVIGSGGKTIRSIIEQTGAKIEVDDTGEVNISSVNEEFLKKAIQMVIDLTSDPEEGRIYEGTVKRIVDFGAFVEILPNRDGLLHISEIMHGRVERVSDHLKEGDKLQVKVLEVEPEGRIRLSRKALLERPEGSEEASPQSPRGREGEGRSHFKRHRGGSGSRD